MFPEFCDDVCQEIRDKIASGELPNDKVDKGYLLNDEYEKYCKEIHQKFAEVGDYCRPILFEETTKALDALAKKMRKDPPIMHLEERRKKYGIRI